MLKDSDRSLARIEIADLLRLAALAAGAEELFRYLAPTRQMSFAATSPHAD